MSQGKLDKLRLLEKQVKKLQEIHVRTSERIKLLRQQRDECIHELEEKGVNPKKIKKYLEDLNQEIAEALKKIEDQIPPSK